MFNDIRDLHTGMGACAVHGRDCLVDFNSFMIVVGYSCKNLSSLNKNAKTDVLSQEIGSTWQTGHALLKYLRVAQPPIAVLENVDEMGKSEDDSHNVAFMNGMVRSLGYATATRVLKAEEFYLPQRRRRAWTILISLVKFGLDIEQADSILKKMFDLVERLHTPPCVCAAAI